MTVMAPLPVTGGWTAKVLGGSDSVSAAAGLTGGASCSVKLSIVWGTPSLGEGKVRRLQSGGGMVVPVADDDVENDQASGDVEGREGFDRRSGAGLRWAGAGRIARLKGGCWAGRVSAAKGKKREQQGKAIWPT